MPPSPKSQRSSTPSPCQYTLEEIDPWFPSREWRFRLHPHDPNVTVKKVDGIFILETTYDPPIQTRVRGKLLAWEASVGRKARCW